MKLNKKSILALVLSLAMAMSLVPFAAFAEDGENAAPKGDTEITVDEDLTEEKIEELVEEIFEAEAPVSEEPEEEAAEESEETAEAPEEIAEEAAEIIEEPAEEVAEDETAEQLEEAPAEEADEFDVEAAYEYLMTLTEEEEEAYALTLTEEQIEALRAYIIENDVREYKVPETVVFTEAGPFMPAVEVETSAEPAGEAEAEEEPKAALPPKKLMMKALGAKALAAPAPSYVEPTDSDNNGLFLSKTAIDNGDGTYKITLQAYTTGTVTTETKTTPVDIVLVLDQSGSMTEDFNGTSRQAAMKSAISAFIDAVNEKYSSDSDHRMAIVTFASEAKKLRGWTAVDGTGMTTLQGKISGLTTPSGATNVGAGMQLAQSLLIGDDYTYDGKNNVRQKVVIVFTDGVPTTASDFSVQVANTAISSAKALKDEGVTIYSIGIFTGANVDELYGSAGFNHNSDGTEGSYWGRRFITLIGALLLGDVYEWDVPAGNRFLNYLSSNYILATNIGLKQRREDSFGDHQRGWEITENFVRTANSYYLTAENSKDLNDIFETITQNIQTASIDLGSSAVVKDIVSPYFKVPADASDIKVYTADYDGSKFGDLVESNLTPVITDDTITVSGFDFNENFVSQTEKTAGSRNYGKKLIIEFTATPKDTFWGGNGVPTNGEASGVYTGSGACVENFEQPKVDVPIKEPAIRAENKTIYYGQDAPAFADLFIVNEAREGWDDAFVNIETVYAPNTVSDTADGTYKATVSVTPKTDGTYGKQEKDATAKVTVVYCTLTIDKSVTGLNTGNDENQSFIFHVVNDSTKCPVDMDVCVVGSDRVTIGRLPIGTYTVTEKSGWSWRYSIDSENSDNSPIELEPSESGHVKTFGITNKRTNPFWLNGCSYAINSWTADGVEEKKIQKGKEQ